MLALYTVAGRFSGDTEANPRLFWILGGFALTAVFAAILGRRRGWTHRQHLLVAWPIASLTTTLGVGVVDSAATQNLPGTITIAFAYVGLTCSRWRSLALVPLGAAAFIVGGAKDLPDALPTVIVTAIMWVLVAEVPAWLIARLHAQSELLRHIARTDTLTQLLNRSTLAAQLNTQAGESAVVLIDLDNFKPYNDRHGHEAGDQLLIGFADTLRWSAREQDLIFRIGGDEFLLLLVGADHIEAERILDRIQRRWGEAGEPVSFSAGIATGGSDLIRIADERMYDNKRARGESRN